MDNKIQVQNGITRDRHQAVIQSFDELYKAAQEPFQKAERNQRPNTASILDIVYAQLAVQYFYSKTQIERIIGGKYRYEHEAEDQN